VKNYGIPFYIEYRDFSPFRVRGKEKSIKNFQNAIALPA